MVHECNDFIFFSLGFLLSILYKYIHYNCFFTLSIFSHCHENQFAIFYLSQLHLDSMISINEYPPLLPFLLHFLLWCTHHATTTITTSTIAPPADTTMIIHSSISWPVIKKVIVYLFWQCKCFFQLDKTNQTKHHEVTTKSFLPK